MTRLIGKDGEEIPGDYTPLIEPAFLDLEAEKKKGKRRVPAYYLTFNTLPAHKPPHHLRVFLDCDGYPIPWGYDYGNFGSSGHALHCPGGEWAYPNWVCHTEWGLVGNPGMIVDRRSWQQILAGCCPKFGFGI